MEDKMLKFKWDSVYWHRKSHLKRAKLPISGWKKVVEYYFN